MQNDFIPDYAYILINYWNDLAGTSLKANDESSHDEKSELNTAFDNRKRKCVRFILTEEQEQQRDQQDDTNKISFQKGEEEEEEQQQLEPWVCWADQVITISFRKITKLYFV